MLKKLSIALIFGGYLSSAFAFHVLDTTQARSMGYNANQLSEQPAPPTPNHYTDFSGIWQGTCTTTKLKGSFDMLVTIYNDANFIKIDYADGFSEQYYIGHYVTHSETEPNHTRNNHTLIHWTKDGNALSIQSYVVDYIHYEKEPLLSFSKSTQMMELDNDQLSLTGSEMVEDIMDATFSCKLMREKSLP